MRSNCCVIGCKSESEGSAERRLFLVPVQPSRRKAWLTAVGRSRTTQNQANKKENHLYVCSAHFISKAKSNVPGNPDYVPRLNLPRSRTVLIDRKRKTISARAKPTTADESDYTHELYSSCCASSRLNASTDDRLQQDRGYLLLVERMDLNFGLLDKLLASGVLNEVEYDEVKAGYKKLSKYLERSMKRSPDVSNDVVMALQSTKQQHLLNYLWNSGMYSPKIGSDWPLTDRQMMALNVNQEILLELMEMSPELIEELYSRNVLTKRHKDFISGQLSELKKSETFLDILRRRSFRDYKETIKCLRASKQTHIAEILEGGAVIRILCRPTIKASKCSTVNRSQMETLVQRFSEELKKQSLDGEDKKLQLTRIGLIGVKFDNAIVLYFKCKSIHDLIDLETAFDNGEINSISKSDFRMFLPGDDQHFTAMLEWSREDSKRCGDYYLCCRSFSDTCIDNLPMEVLEIILTKTYALCFYRVHPRPREEELFAMLSSVSRYWHKTICRPNRFKAALNRRLYPYFLSVTKRQTIIRRNWQYLVEHLEPSSNLIRRLEQDGCLTSEEANYIESLQRKTAKNHELLTVAKSMSLEKHFAFVESLHFCGQLKVANVLEKGGVVFKTMATCDRVSINAEFIKKLNEEIPETDRKYGELEPYTRSFDVAIPKEMELLDVQPLRTRKGKTFIAIWLWCKSQKSSRRLCKLADSDRLIKLLDILMTFIWSKSTEHFHSYPGETYTLQFLKKLCFKTMQFQRAVVVRQLAVKFSGKFNLPIYSRAFTSLEDKIYFLAADEIWVHQYMAPYACQFKTVFPPSEPLAVYPDNCNERGWFIEACHQTKCIYVARRSDQRVWKLTTPEYNLEVWKHYLATLCSLSVTSNGNVLILKDSRPLGKSHNAYFLAIYTNDAVLLYNINLGMPLNICMQGSLSVLEMSPGNFAIKCKNTLLVKSVNFDTRTTTDQNRIQYSYNGRDPYCENLANIALYSQDRLIVIPANKLTILDSRLKVDYNIMSNSITLYAQQLNYRMDKRQLMAYSPELNSVKIFTLQYEG